MPDQMMTKDYVAVIDIGSNAVRLMVYDGFNRAPFKIHSERVVCNLGIDLSRTGNLNPESVKKAFDAIARFAGLIKAMKIQNVLAVATAAMRDAKDGKAFIERVQSELQLTIKIIDGEEEARLSALGVLANGFGGDGVIGDYGGGSLELIVIENGQVKEKASLPLGSHRLIVEKGRDAQMKMINTYLDSVSFLKHHTGKNFYAMGGAWRTMATAHLHMTGHPIKLLDHYQVDGMRATEFAELISTQNLVSLEKMVGMSQKRIKDMGVAALTMNILFKKIYPRELIFSATGLREGLLFDQLPVAVRQEDALLASCYKIAAKTSRFDDIKSFKLLFDWLKLLFTKEDAGARRLIEASCYLSDGAWFEQEDYQADHAFERVLVMPFYGVDHAGRAFLALSQYMRYKSNLRRPPKMHELDEVTKPARKLLNEKTMELAMTVGLVQRLGYMLTGGVLGLLADAALSVTDTQLILTLKPNAAMLNAEAIETALQGLAEALGKEPLIVKN